MNEHMLMQCLPNTGSTWLGGVIARNIPGCRYYQKEFFNPICNLKHEKALSKVFGSELVSCYENIAEGDGPLLDSCIEETWGSEDYSFTKECWSPFKTEAFTRHFRVFVLDRSREHTFPPSRVRVWSFYEHAWWALKKRGFSLGAESTKARAEEAFDVMRYSLLSDAARLGLPVISYERLWGGQAQVEAEISKALPEHDADIAKEILESRSNRKVKP